MSELLKDVSVLLCTLGWVIGATAALIGAVTEFRAWKYRRDMQVERWKYLQKRLHLKYPTKPPDDGNF